MKEFKALENERVERKLTPHPLSFMHLHALWIFLAAWAIFLAWFFRSPYWNKMPDVEILQMGGAASLWLAGLAMAGVVASLLMIRWRIFFTYIAIFVVGMFLFWLGGVMEYLTTFIPLYTFIISLLGLALVEIYRRSHRYFITNMRLVLRGGILLKRERTLRYDRIADVDYSQGILGRLFNYGNIVPITQSGFGLGNDTAFAAGGVAAGAKKKRFGLFGFAGGGKEVKTPRARSYYELHGVYPFPEVKMLVEEKVQEGSIAPYEREQVRLQKEMLDLLRGNQEKEEEKD